MTVRAQVLPFRIDPLPDFLEDHTLLSEDAEERLREHAVRWVQFIEGLWSWCDRATFALRYFAAEGTTSCYFVANALDAREAPLLDSEVRTALHAHRLVRAIEDPAVSAEEFAAATRLSRPRLVDLCQYAPRNLWQPTPQSTSAVDQKLYPDLDPTDWTSPPVVYAWHGAGGPFLLPMESLASQGVPVALTIYLQPTLLRPSEWGWLAHMSRSAQSMADENVTAVGRGAASRRVDPSATLAGELYGAALRRLSSTPFLVLAQCAAGEDSTSAAQTLAASLQSIPHERSLLEPHSGRELPPAACAPYRSVRDESASRALYESCALGSAIEPGGLGRLPLLTDALGSSTMFRFPVSVRGGVPGIVVKQLPPDFRPGPRLARAPEGHVELGRFEGGGVSSVPVDDLTRHVLVTGFTGSGKTWTVLQLVHQLWVDHSVPVLVLESAKQEYRGLATVPAISAKHPGVEVYTLGNESCVPFRLNPFELQPGVRVEAHISRLQTCFEAAVPQVGPSTSVITEALYAVYEDRGFLLTDMFEAGAEPRRRFPTMRDFVDRIEQIIATRGYKGEVLSNLQAALIGRFAPLLMGGKGRMFDVQRSVPSASELFSKPVVLEMNDLNLDDKALVVMFILTTLREHRERNPGRGRLAHVTVVEEAHNVLEDVASEGSGEGSTKGDTRYKAVQAFCAMLAEIRSLGEGIVISDQSPQKLARDAIRNTNVQLAHQLRDGDDRDAMARAMIMDEHQRDFLGKLDRGAAAMFRTGLEKATFIQVTPYAARAGDRGFGLDASFSDAEVRDYMRRLNRLPHQELPAPLQGCEFCARRCEIRDAVFPVVDAKTTRERVASWIALTSRKEQSKREMTIEDVWDSYVTEAVADLVGSAVEADLDSIWCHFVHGWTFSTSSLGKGGESVRLTEQHLSLLAASLERVQAARRSYQANTRS